MNLSEQNRKNLAAMRLVEAVSSRLGTGSWLWGGLVPDVYAGQMLREHDDLDYLTWNLHILSPAFAKTFARDGWQTQSLENGDLKLKKDGVKIQLGDLEFKAQARWKHNGPKGCLLFPEAWLRIAPIRFYEAEIHVVEPELQYVLKAHPELLNPAWQPREKDLQDKRQLQSLLLGKQTNIDRLASQVYSL